MREKIIDTSGRVYVYYIHLLLNVGTLGHFNMAEAGPQNAQTEIVVKQVTFVVLLGLNYKFFFSEFVFFLPDPFCGLCITTDFITDLKFCRSLRSP